MSFVEQMNNSKPQSWDLGRPDAPTISDVRHLGGRGALYLLALVQAHHARIRVAPTLEGTHDVLSLLDALGVIRFDRQAEPESHKVTGDKLAWSYTWTHVPFGELDAQLKDYLQGEAQEPPYAETWLRVWQELVPQDVTAYLWHQLRIHQFPDFFLVELARLLMPYDSQYSLGHWRYACWAAVRSMASISLQYPGNAEILKFTLSSELPRRLRLTQGSLEGKLCFSPSHSLPDCALTSVFSTVATRLGDRYWMSPPVFELI
ncbi:hypothetical protein ABQE95_17825 [Xanthomonas campestris pv. campestris]|uniref:hypothetical protein n=1 Tax=Xanthomonas TaxID=338 RepID=UPI0018196186|nr:hypothetical protein [Xanthomonas campestris]MEB1199386.1 hypothetical protein [Xanthomonas campestris pv. campestris]MEA9534133.1 hypothetical protein [Xanthomonas campestris]MEB1270033.1 hypothetical protein [Xanthomonas campestris pv. campestris]MEB1282481.1 hypothetical protein [Xanthomonas campestris pv. campestris]MEB1344883.1 hypothetical protein [Xanthomonas campestris pv. campestris]